jgi:catechol 2,3-dioxygenase-like lactoylglutathione lyase family enzyme
VATQVPVGGVHHLRLTVTDLARSRAFYTGLLGFEVIAESPPDDDPSAAEVFKILFGGIVMSRGDLILGLRPVAPAGDRFSENRSGLDHLSFGVPSHADLVAAAALFDEHGVRTGRSPRCRRSASRCSSGTRTTPGWSDRTAVLTVLTQAHRADREWGCPVARLTNGGSNCARRAVHVRAGNGHGRRARDRVPRFTEPRGTGRAGPAAVAGASPRAAAAPPLTVRTLVRAVGRRVVAQPARCIAAGRTGDRGEAPPRPLRGLSWQEARPASRGRCRRCRWPRRSGSARTPAAGTTGWSSTSPAGARLRGQVRVRQAWYRAARRLAHRGDRFLLITCTGAGARPPRQQRSSRLRPRRTRAARVRGGRRFPRAP